MNDTSMVVNNVEKEEWYSSLVEECKALVTEAVFTSRWALVEGYWNLGKTIKENDNFQKFAKNNRGSLQNIAKNLEMSERTLYYSLQLFEKYPQIEKLPEGKNITWGKLINKYLPKAREARASLPLPEGEFDVIYADPPWKYDFSETTTREIENQYETMETHEIAGMKIPAAKNSVLFLWATAPKLREALSVMQSWGFEYKTHAIWDKELIGMGYWFRGRHELLLVGTKGEFFVPEAETREASVYREKRTAHSKKPDHYYGLIEKMYPTSHYLELFARQKHNDKWTVWGNETEKYDK
jgi:N6-adenosine-specific RNA methylase IME4